jgi:hypothetical protein
MGRPTGQVRPQQKTSTLDRARAERRDLERLDLQARALDIRAKIDGAAGLAPAGMRGPNMAELFQLLGRIGVYLDDLDGYLKERP